MGKPMLNTKVYFHRDKEDNWDIQEEAESVGFSVQHVKDLAYLGYEIEFDVNITVDDSGELQVTIVSSPESLM